jgi:hypothetical protein
MAKRSQNGSTGSPSRAKSRGSRKSPRRFASPTASSCDERRRGKQSEAAGPEFVIVTFADDLEQAKEYETLLEANGIPATIKEQDRESATTYGIAVMVPEDYLDEAHVIIESQDAYDDFYDFALEDEDEDDFDSELFEDDF